MKFVFNFRTGKADAIDPLAHGSTHPCNSENGQPTTQIEKLISMIARIISPHTDARLVYFTQ